MADSNNHLAGRLPPAPDSRLASLEPLLGTWEIGGGFLSGTTRFAWMEGGFYLCQHIDAEARGRPIVGIEYVGFDADTETLRSHYMDIHGANFTYTWEIEGEEIRTWFGDRGSDNHFTGRFVDGGARYVGAWEWPGGGYEAAMTRVG